MLAERRKKVVWSNPRGTIWANDKKKFGQKILESMGWREGFGLGKNRDGITENIKASYKFDNKGFGYQRSNNSIEDDCDEIYKKIIADLKQHHSDDVIQTSEHNNEIHMDLEAKARQINSIRYKKFIKAKNLSTKSIEDLNGVFSMKICRSKTNDFAEKCEETLLTREKKKEIVLNHHHIEINSGMTVADYFKQKMQSKKFHKDRSLKEQRFISKCQSSKKKKCQ
ncbi:PIN2/TERF1-interacting telomerase inhibitor 1 [Sarcoptes scabiei]|uniref:PIN2/TERF1-interacting telomerase inhibitor 1 n=2 Tax=Sarcoptes scabiei TaxID=52283 RepID=A0A834R9Z1_SARSC|nr:PIN2/TERF1-interacting telomerase inhibitor 1 [Sarcoptes scabiei]